MMKLKMKELVHGVLVNRGSRIHTQVCLTI